MSDIFKDMQSKVGCDYISDLPSYKRKVWRSEWAKMCNRYLSIDNQIDHRSY